MPDFSHQHVEHQAEPLERDHESLQALATLLNDSLGMLTEPGRIAEQSHLPDHAEFGRSLSFYAQLVADLDAYHFNHGPLWRTRNVEHAYRCVAAEGVIRALNPFSADEIKHLAELEYDRSGSDTHSWGEDYVKALRWSGGGPRIVEVWSQLLHDPKNVADPVALLDRATDDLAATLRAEAAAT